MNKKTINTNTVRNRLKKDLEDVFHLSCFQTVFLVIAHQYRLIVIIDHLYHWVVEFVSMSCCGNAHGPVNEKRLNDDTKGFTTTGQSQDFVKRYNTASLTIKSFV